METNFATRDDFVDALKSALSEARDIEKLFELWERNVKTVRDFSRCADRRSANVNLAKTLVAHFKECARAHATPAQDATVVETEHPNGEKAKIDKSVLTIGEPKRIRSKEHLRFVAKSTMPDLRPIAGSCPSHPVRASEGHWFEGER